MVKRAMLKRMPTQTKCVTSMVTLLVVGSILIFKEGGLEMSSMYNGVTSHASDHSDPTSQFVPSWEFVNDTVPYLGNLECVFATSLGMSIRNASDCGKLRYHPYQGYNVPDPIAVFRKLPNQTTIYMIGDSVTVQHGVDVV